MKYVIRFIFFLLLCWKGTHGQIRLLNGRTVSKQAVTAFVQQQMDSLKIKGISLAIINNGKIVYHLTKGAGAEVLFEAASLAKPLFSFFVMRLVEKGVLELDKPLYTYVEYPEAANDERYRLITARMVLSHTTGFPNWRQGDSLKLLFNPGSAFSYSGEGYMYLAKVIAHLTKCSLDSLDSLFRQEVAVPVGLRHTHFSMTPYVHRNLSPGYKRGQVVFDSSWDRNTFDPAGGLYSEALDYATFLNALMQQKLLKKESVAELLKEQVVLATDDRRRKQSGITGWGLGFSRQPSPYGMNFLHGGNNLGYTSFFMINQEKKFGFVFFTNADQCNELKERMQSFLTDGRSMR